MTNAAMIRSIPPEVRLMLTMAGWLLPRSLRSEWKREWLAEFSEGCLGEHKHLTAIRKRRGMFSRAAGAILDSWTLTEIHGLRQRLTEAAHSRTTPVSLAAIALIAIACATHGFREARAVLSRTERADLVLLVQPVPFMGGSARVPMEQANLWQRTGSTVEELGAWSVESGIIEGRHVRILKATPVAANLLATSPVQPRHDRVQLTQGSAREFAAIIAKLRPGATRDQAEAELAKTAKYRKGWQAPGLVVLSSIQKAPLIPVGGMVVALLLFNILSLRTHSFTAFLWGLAAPSLWQAVVTGVWLESLARAPMTEAGQVSISWTAILYVLPIAAASFITWWSRRAAAYRCRMCYRPLMKAVLVGMEGRCLFEPGGREYLCADGHGALIVGYAAQNETDEVWTSWSNNWA
jgi:hypothetical protein